MRRERGARVRRRNRRACSRDPRPSPSSPVKHGRTDAREKLGIARLFLSERNASSEDAPPPPPPSSGHGRVNTDTCPASPVKHACLTGEQCGPYGGPRGGGCFL